MRKHREAQQRRTPLRLHREVHAREDPGRDDRKVHTTGAPDDARERGRREAIRKHDIA
jgi:hypothetical protein